MEQQNGRLVSARRKEKQLFMKRRRLSESVVTLKNAGLFVLTQMLGSACNVILLGYFY